MDFKAVHYTKIPVEKVEESGVEGVEVRWLITEEDGAENFAMRLFDVKPGGHTPFHSHDWEHEVFVLEGEGSICCERSEKRLSSDYVVFVPPNAEHCFKNTGTEILRFLCLIPHHK